MIPPRRVSGMALRPMKSGRRVVELASLPDYPSRAARKRDHPPPDPEIAFTLDESDQATPLRRLDSLAIMAPHSARASAKAAAVRLSPFR